jgi:long-chain acyl-CoA synthetase
MAVGWLLERMKQWNEEAAIVWQDEICSYGRLLEYVDHWTDRLKEKEIKPGEIVALEGDYSPNACSLLLALIQNRNIVVPIAGVSEEHRNEFTETAEVQVVIKVDTLDEYRLELRQADVQNALTLRLIRQSLPGLVLFSSGSTGKNKGILHDFVALLDKYRVPRKRMRTLTFLLLDHIGGINTLFYTLANGGTVVTVGKRDPDSVCASIERHRVELLPTSPTFLNLMLISEAYSRYDISSLNLITYGTEVMPEKTLKRLQGILPGVRLQQTYGLSELGILQSKSKSSDSLWVKLGGDGFETKVVDGVLWIRARSAMMGYLNHPSPFDDEGWLNTEDMVEVHGEYFKVLGRRSDIINVGGQKVYPAEVESVLMEMENIADVTVRGEKNPITGNFVVARLLLDEPEKMSDLKRRIRKFCKDRLEDYKLPVKVEISEELEFTDRFKKARASPMPRPHYSNIPTFQPGRRNSDK